MPRYNVIIELDFRADDIDHAEDALDEFLERTAVLDEFEAVDLEPIEVRVGVPVRLTLRHGDD